MQWMIACPSHQGEGGPNHFVPQWTPHVNAPLLFQHRQFSFCLGGFAQRLFGKVGQAYLDLPFP